MALDDERLLWVLRHGGISKDVAKALLEKIKELEDRIATLEGP